MWTGSQFGKGNTVFWIWNVIQIFLGIELKFIRRVSIQDCTSAFIYEAVPFMNEAVPDLLHAHYFETIFLLLDSLRSIL